MIETKNETVVIRIPRSAKLANITKLEKTRYSMACVRYVPDEEGGKLVASDGRAMVIHKLEGHTEGEPLNIPRKAIDAATKGRKAGEGEVRIDGTKIQAGDPDKGTWQSSETEEGSYPDWQRLLETVPKGDAKGRVRLGIDSTLLADLVAAMQGGGLCELTFDVQNGRVNGPIGVSVGNDSKGVIMPVKVQ